MAPNAVIFSVILSLFLLLAGARLDPSSSAVTVSDQEKKNGAETTTTAFHVSLPLTSFRDDGDLSRQIAHSLRFPLNRHHHLSLPHHRIEVPYGDDMVGLPKAEEKKKKLKKTKKEKRDDDRDSDSDSDDDKDELKEIQHKKMKKMMKKKEGEGKGGILKWISGFLN